MDRKIYRAKRVIDDTGGDTKTEKNDGHTV